MQYTHSLTNRLFDSLEEATEHLENSVKDFYVSIQQSLCDKLGIVGYNPERDCQEICPSLLTKDELIATLKIALNDLEQTTFTITELEESRRHYHIIDKR